MMELANADMASAPEAPPSYRLENQTENDLPAAIVTDKKKIIRDGSITIKVKDLEAAKSRVDTLVQQFNAYYNSENLMNYEFSVSYRLSIRIPSAMFDKFISAVESGDGEVTEKIINALDVTTEFIDLESRLINKRSYLERYRELLKQARTVKEILEIEEQIRTIVEEIDSTEGRLKYLSDQVSYSTLNLTLNKDTGYGYHRDIKGPFGERLKRSLSGGWNGLVTLTLVLIRLWPLLIILAVVIPVWVTYRKKRKL